MTRTRVPGRLLVLTALVSGLTMAACPALAATDAPRTSARVAQAVQASPSLIDANAVGSIALHATVGAPLNQDLYPRDGSPLTLPSSATPLPDMTYTVTKVDGVDLTTAAGWQLANQYQNDVSAARAHLGASVTSAPTDATGLTVVSNLPVGLYLVHERPSQSSDSSFTQVRDFLVTVPMTNPKTQNSWVYDINVYPKRERLHLVKTVLANTVGSAAAGAAAGDSSLITYGLKADVPSGGVRAFGGQCERDGQVDQRSNLDHDGFTSTGWCAAGATYVGTAKGAAYDLIDDLTTSKVPKTSFTLADFLELTATDWTGSVAVSVPGIADWQACPSPTVSTGCDYQLTLQSSALKVVLTDQGLQRLAQAKEANPDTTMNVTFDARVSEAGATRLRSSVGNGGVLTLPNTATLLANQQAVASAAGVASNVASLKYAALRVHKIDASSKANLAGAEFTAYASEADAKAGKSPVAVSQPTGANGIVVMPGLVAIDNPTGTSGPGHYWLVETKAPTGYARRTAPLAATLLPDGTTLDADTTGGLPVLNTRSTSHDDDNGSDNGSTDGSDSNSSKRPGKLAFTGSEIGVMLATALFLVGVGVPLARRRRRSETGVG